MEALKTLNLTELVEKNKSFCQLGKVANYIPELDKANPNDFGVCILDMDNNEYCIGDYEKKFTIQSISKIVTLMLALLDNGSDYVFSKVGMEPSGDPFNSIRKLETSSRKKPYNPMINAGAIAVSSMIKGDDGRHKFQRLLDFFRQIVEDDQIDVNYKIYIGESETGNRNRSMGYFLKSEGIIKGDVEEALDIYFKQCSIEVTARNIAKLGLFLARNGATSTGEQLVPYKIIRIIKTLMFTCGMYDKSGEFAVKVGLPSKSGVGGGIVSVVPGKLGIGIYSPALDEKGNPLAGTKFLEDFTEIFDFRVL
ncbi:glutaminase A [Cetobacterium sp. SF1]|uniref:glutaminase A n=1 Tax=unclassified Cetobacterium TaxID=2630983 RepID=UPI003CE882B3